MAVEDPFRAKVRNGFSYWRNTVSGRIILERADLIGQLLSWRISNIATIQNTRHPRKINMLIRAGQIVP